MSMRPVVAAHAIGHRLEPFARHVDRRAVGQMAAGGQVEAHEGVAGLQQREEHRLVGLAAGIAAARWRSAQPNSLVTRSIASCSAIVDELAAAVIALARDSPRHICWSAPSPAPPARRGETMFSDAISSISSRWRPSSQLDGAGNFGIGSRRATARKSPCSRDLCTMRDRHALPPCCYADGSRPADGRRSPIAYQPTGASS